MNPLTRAVTGLLALVVTLVTARAVEPTWNYAVQVEATVQSSPAQISLSWPQDTSVTPVSYTVYRKTPSATAWGSAVALAGTATNYVDTTVAAGTAYEYQVVKNSGSYTGYGYIEAGVNVPLVESRGKAVLLVDNTQAGPLAAELARLQQDLAGDGWTVLRHDVARNDSVTNVKAIIKADYQADPANVKAVFLFGHVPVPYSGLQNPDGHPDHIGAWPADVYYGDMDGTWTDSSVNYIQTANTDPADAARLTNVPGDGKFDQTTLPSAVELQVGRVDLANMPGRTTWGGPATFPNETELLRNYLNKDHDFRHRIMNVPQRAVVDDKFGIRDGEAFAASGYRSFAPIVGSANITNLNLQTNGALGVWIPDLAAHSYLLSYANGPGSYKTIGGLGNVGQYNDTNTVELVSNDVHAVFHMLFGSWLGDWDNEDNILRAPLATRTNGLAAMWSGRPHWFTQGLGLGETIGYTARLSQNNAGLYQSQVNNAANRIHVALMGDPTLRALPVAPATSLSGSFSGSTASLNWNASADSVLGYHVYRGTSAAGPFTRLTSSPVTATSFTDSAAIAGATYMVRAVQLARSPSGTYYDASQGAFWSTGGTAPTDTTAPTVALSAPTGGNVSGSLAVTATATDNLGVVGVQFKLDGANLGSEVTGAPYTTTWNSTATANGAHALTAVARDAAGNQRTSASVTVNVSNTVATGTPPAPGSGTVLWVDDAMPAGAGGSASGGDSWNWVRSSPAPWAGVQAHQSNLAAGLHEHAFNWASTTLAVGTGDTFFTFVYLDPANPPTELMLSWVADNWEHRAYWGSDRILYGTNNTASRRYMGGLPPAGQWVRLDIPASAVGLEGQTVTGMSFSLFDGRATWDYTGKAAASAAATVSVAATDGVAAIGTSDNAVLTFTRTGSTAAPLTVNYTLGGNAVKWIDYRRVEGDMPVSVTIPAGSASATMTIAAIANATNANPETAVFTLAADAAYTVGSANSATITLSGGTTVSPTTPIAVIPTPVTTTTPTAGTIWFDDALPSGASGSGTGGDGWNWISGSPTPFSGSKAHQSNLASGLHEHSFNWASTILGVNTSDTLFAYVYLDPANPPTELMLSWKGDNWEHRAYWGANTITYGTNGTASRRSMGALPAKGQWVRLEVPASAVGLEGQSVTGMAFSLQGGRATWDAVGKGSQLLAGTAQPTVTVAATDGTATINSTDNARLTFTRTGSTTAALTVNYTLGGTAVKWIDYRRVEGDMPVSITIPAGATTATMNLVAVANVTNANPATAVFTLAPDPAYTVGPATAATVTLASGSATGGTSGGTSGGTVTSSGGSSSGGTSSGGTTYNLATMPVSDRGDYTTLNLPQVGSSLLHVLAPTTVELVRINTETAGSTMVDSWNFVDAAGRFTAPATSKFAVTVNGQPVAVQQVGFKRRPLYAPLVVRDLRIASTLELQLAAPVPEGAAVEVKNPDGSLWSAAMTFAGTAHPLRYSPAIHVNQEGYAPNWPKQAAVGYYLGSLGEMNVGATSFSLVDNLTGATVFQGTLTSRPDQGWTYSPTPYQKVYEADFSAFTTPGEYLLVVPGLGASLPFMIDQGLGMDFARTYALGLYAQRCGFANLAPFTRFVHEICHDEPAEVPSPASSYAFTWTTIAAYANTINSNNPAQIAPRLTSESAQLYPFVNRGPVDVTGGHHDAGDYSKYTINSASLVHFLMFAVDSLPGVANLDNLGLPESGDGISDVMQEAKWETDFLAKMQDADGGFYFLVYPKNREYESNVLPDHGDQQVVWPKNTAATAAAVAALAEAGSSPRFKARYPAEAALYLQKAQLGWQFLANAIARYGKAGAYQKITHYGDDFTHDDELAWAAAAMFAATGDASYQQTLKSWFDPSDPANWRWGWWHGYMGFGNAERTYAFAVRSGRLFANQVDSAYLAKCEAELRAAGDDALTWSNQSAYGTSFPLESKHVQSAGWYFSGAQTFDLTVAYQLDARADYFNAIVRNANYEAGSNPVNVSYVTGLGWKRQQEIVHQYAQNDRRMLPPNGIPLGNIQTGPVYTSTYGTELAALTFPRDNDGSAPTPFYDRWSDTFNVTTEFVHLDQARAFATYAFLGAQSPGATQAWTSAAGTITGLPDTVAQNTPVTARFEVPGMDLSAARILWEAKGQQPAYGPTFTFVPTGNGDQWVEAEAQWADGRRVVGVASIFSANGLPTVTVAATDATATLGNSADTATWTFTRTGDTSAPLTVNFAFTGSAAKWTDYRRPQGDMPETLTIPAGAASATLTIYAVANSTGANPETVTLTLVDTPAAYNTGASYRGTITIK